MSYKSKLAEPQLITLAAAARHMGLATATASKLGDGFPKIHVLGARRYVARKAFESWLEQILGNETHAAA